MFNMNCRVKLSIKSLYWMSWHHVLRQGWKYHCLCLTCQKRRNMGRVRHYNAYVIIGCVRTIRRKLVSPLNKLCVTLYEPLSTLFGVWPILWSLIRFVRKVVCFNLWLHICIKRQEIKCRRIIPVLIRLKVADYILTNIIKL